ncbi:MAG: hypothetical protein ACI82G_003280, partial [Bradymonadia bacterium]
VVGSSRSSTSWAAAGAAESIVATARDDVARVSGGKSDMLA